jgi:hypothetical protein
MSVCAHIFLFQATSFHARICFAKPSLKRGFVSNSSLSGLTKGSVDVSWDFNLEKV